MYFVIQYYWPDDRSEPFVKAIEPLGVPGMSKFAGKPFPASFPEMRIIIYQLGQMPDICIQNCHLCMTPDCISRLQEVGETHFETWPVRIVAQTGGEDAESLRIVNLLDNVSCMDMEKSQFKLDRSPPHDILKIRRLVLDESRIPADRHLFRMAEFETVFLISEPLRDLFVADGLPAFLFQPSHEFDTEMPYDPERWALEGKKPE